jgi:hypothetical protein
MTLNMMIVVVIISDRFAFWQILLSLAHVHESSIMVLSELAGQLVDKSRFPTRAGTWGAVSLSVKKRNGSNPDLPASVVPVDFLYSPLILKMSAPDARPIIRGFSVDETPSQNSQMLAGLAILRDEL